MSGVVSAVIAVVAVATAASSISAAVAVGAVTLSAVFTTVAAVGAVVSTIGALTGDKTLQTVGMVVGAVGGIGAIANSVGMFGAGATVEGLFGSGSDAVQAFSGSGGVESVAAAPVEGAASGASSLGGQAAEAVASGGEALSSAVQPVTVNGIAEAGGFANPAQEANLVPGSLGQGDAPTGIIGDGGTTAINPPASTVSTTPVDASTVTGGPVAPDVTPVGAPTTVAPSAPGSPADLGIPGSANAASTAASTVGPVTAPASAGGGSAIGGIFDFMNKNSALTMGTFQAASSFIAGAFGGDKEPPQEQLNYWQAQADANTAAANLQKQRLANMQSGIPRASGGGQISVTPAGLINQQRTVTGVPA